MDDIHTTEERRTGKRGRKGRNEALRERGRGREKKKKKKKKNERSPSLMAPVPTVASNPSWIGAAFVGLVFLWHWWVTNHTVRTGCDRLSFFCLKASGWPTSRPLLFSFARYVAPKDRTGNVVR